MTVIARFKRTIREQQFAPTWLGPFVNPFFLARRALRREMTALAPQVRGRLLDIGCGTKPYRDLFQVDDYIGLEIGSASAREHSAADVFYDGDTFPFPEASFDAVLCNQVLEHVFNPTEFLAEIGRVLRPGGKLLLTVPFVWDEHEQPWDYARYSSFGLAHLIKSSGFQPTAHRKTLADASLFGQMFNAYLFKIAWSRHTVWNYLLMGAVMAPVSLFGMALGKMLPRNPDLYLDNILLAVKSGGQEPANMLGDR